MAVMKRASSVILGAQHIYVRPPSASPVHLFSYWPAGKDADLLSECGIEKLRFFRKNNTFRPETDSADRAWTHCFITLVSRGEPMPNKYPELFTSSSETVLDNAGRMVSIRHVKRKPSLDAPIAAGERRKRERPDELVDEVKPEEMKMESQALALMARRRKDA
eukprot:5411852-Amphidinium_carterae.1